MNARFNVLIHGEQVPITLKPGQTLSWGAAWRHEEGWSSVSYVWSFDGEYVTQDYATDGRDCDGRLSTESVTECHVHHLRAHTYTLNHADGERTYYAPKWETVRSGQRDYSAEAMGY